jgi:aspartyl protease family protein
MYSSGHRSLLGEVLSWVFCSAVLVASIIHFEDLKALAHRVIGTEPAVVASLRQSDPTVQVAAEVTSAAADGYTVEVPLGRDGHYHVDADINGRSVAVLVDTGASVVALTAEDADAAGIFVSDADFTSRILTANGAARVAPVVLDEVSIGDITVRDVRAVVSEPGALTVSLLGMTFLNQLDRVDMRSGKLILQD